MGNGAGRGGDREAFGTEAQEEAADGGLPIRAVAEPVGGRREPLEPDPVAAVELGEEVLDEERQAGLGAEGDDAIVLAAPRPLPRPGRRPEDPCEGLAARREKVRDQFAQARAGKLVFLRMGDHRGAAGSANPGNDLRQ